MAENIASEAAPARCPVVGVGASAGGLESIRTFFQAVPRASGAAFVVVQHLSSEFKSFMRDILSRITEMPVLEVRDALRVEPNNIYVLVPGKYVLVENGCLVLRDLVRREVPSKPIDLFFDSLAKDLGSRAVGVVLSGTGNDGTLGARALHEAGGRVLVESPESAKFDGMPQSVIDAGLADVIGLPGELARECVRGAGEAAKAPLAEKVSEVFGPRHLRVFELIQERYGVDFGQYKVATVGRRLDKRLQEVGIDSPERYVEYLEENPSELAHLYGEMLIGVTEFFRDPEAFAILNERVIQSIVKDKAGSDDIRIWVAGCSSGEEAYSIAILAHEACRLQDRTLKVKLFASDLDEGVLSRANEGVYEAEALANLNPELRDRYFSHAPRGYKVSAPLRRSIIFTRHNALTDPPFRGMDLVSCRNLLIYFEEDAQASALASFYFALREGGFLFLGPSESLGGLESGFRVLNRRWRIFEKAAGARLPREIERRYKSQKRRFSAGLAVSASQGADGEVDRAFQTLLQRYVPPSLLVTEDLDILHSFGDAGQYLHPRPGAPGTTLRHLAHERLVTAVSVSLQRAKRERDSVVYRGVEIESFGAVRRLDVNVQPLPTRPNQPRLLYLVTLTALEEVEPAAREPERLQLDERSADRIATLEAELQDTRENLLVTIEELEATNEELQSANEELLASNEELQSTNQELHSVNEELFTVNAEHQAKLEELKSLMEDEQSLVRVGQLGALFLDEKLRVRKFTPAAAAAFNLSPEDQGRPLSRIHTGLEQSALSEQVSAVLAGGEPIEREVSMDGTPYLLRILVHNPGPDARGVVVSVVDASKSKAAALELADMTSERAVQRHQLEQLEKAVEASYWEWHLERDFDCRSPRFWQELGYAQGEDLPEARSWQDLIHPDDRESALSQLEQQLGAGRDREFSQELRYRHRLGHWVRMSCHGRIKDWDVHGMGPRIRALSGPNAAGAEPAPGA